VLSKSMGTFGRGSAQIWQAATALANGARTVDRRQAVAIGHDHQIAIDPTWTVTGSGSTFLPKRETSEELRLFAAGVAVGPCWSNSTYAQWSVDFDVAVRMTFTHFSVHRR
jgi:hypothetical protein